MTSDKTRISVLCSGSGSNLQAIIDACASGRIADGEIVRVTVNRKTAFSRERAEKVGIPTAYFNMVAEKFQVAGEKDAEKLKEARLAYDAALAERILQDKPELVVLAGWMHVFTVNFLNPIKAAGVPIINLHPALPGKYDGAGAIERAYSDFQAGKLENNKTGIMIHYVIAEVDRGEPILVEEIECRQGESLDDFANRLHSHEHELVVRAVTKLSSEIATAKKQKQQQS
ncbi:phosphoribosylglycinamide formyltransferase [Microdochium trichocladiopsis]|uniref:Phosphoribosylglycinamide formyltransferase n=1 Tax=Microdochium trichocladiopsis TaxID=1682393 RepID=A0A9P8YBM8_9PEZI|nr:phosphoribosylglycinamide formyltransferase [Microdochium trichocladiopsis]KAH7034910.1 phosphoribosylglycinamide formyltransferase [Microdochium trichocladiopsis]